MNTEKPAYLSTAEADWEKVSHDPDATPAQTLAAEEALADAREDAKADGYDPA